ncbi:MAG TPA: TonB-dependent receptor [Phenylobacterium sp.]|uniref:TonB-dependent receptor n=1 Tax=Phenylobacterium sp. TaxID=1871053 RepID=UPI002B46D4AD|nr:TonB-dependent receptor [Phenylobacterium sp.]HKR86777.1 TonB-dependent receptor [Phenylobacterium sp.]
MLAGSALAAPAVAAAQSAAAPAQPATSAESKAPTALEEVIVTAQKVTQNLQEAPAAIAVVNRERLVAQGATDIRAVQFMVPSVRLNKQQSNVQMFIRGVGIATDAPSLDLGVALTVNGMEQFREATGASIFDVNRVEVLRGPQATTYGSNAAGGVISVVTERPSNDYSGRAVAEIGNYDRRYLSLAQNLPLGKDSQLRAAFNYIKHDGYAGNGLDDEDNIAGRLTFTTKLGDAADLMLWGGIYHAGGNGDVGYASPFKNKDDPWKQTWDPLATIAFTPAQRAHKRDIDIYHLGGELNVDLDGVRLTYIPGFIYSNHQGHLVIDTGPARILFEEVNSRHQYTQELRLANSNSDAKLQWLVGAYFYDLSTHAFRTVAGNRSFDISEQPNKSYAAYVQGTYALSDALRLTGGLRYSYIHKEAQGNGFRPGLTGAAVPFTADFSWTHADWKVGVEYDVNRDSMLYANVQTGYLGGGVNFFTSPTQSNEVNPEKLLSYAVGSKNTLLDGRMRLNLEAFYYDWKDYQVGLFNVAAGTNIVFNAPKSQSYGVELDMQMALTSHDELSLAAGYFHGEFKDFIVPRGVSSPVRAYDFTGFALPFAPDWSATLHYLHTFDLPNGSTIDASGQVQVASKFWTSFTHGITRCSSVPVTVLAQSACVDTGTLQSAYGLANADLTWHAPDKRFSVGLWIRNITDKAVRTSGGDGGMTSAGVVTTLAASTLTPPRTFGVRLGASW